MLKKLIGLTFLALISVCNTSEAVSQFIVTMSSGDFTLKNNVGVALALNDVIQLGYYTGGVFGNGTGGIVDPTWHPLTGDGGANSAYNYTKIGGDTVNSPGAGAFQFDTNAFPQGDPSNSALYFQAGATTGNDFPAVNQQLTIRFYDATTVAGASHFNAITNDTWLWKTPADNSPSPNPELNISLDNSGNFLLQSNPGVAFTYVTSGFATYSPSASLQTTIATVPEPSSLAFLALAFSMTAAVVRFRKF
jgi:hypothetical protein